jgi:choline monooxygenase
MLAPMTARLAAEIARFDPELPIERATTPPASWYREPAFAELERAAVFGDDWIAVALSQELERPSEQLAVELAGLPLLLVRRENGTLAGFHNACRHHATQLVTDRACGDVIRCPYHGWTYGLDGRLITAPRMGGVQAFEPAAHGLVPVAVTEAVGLVFVHLGAAQAPPPSEVSALFSRLDATGLDGLRFREQRRYRIACDWKVFVDNFLDGGYHVAHLHPDLAGLLDLSRYQTEVEGRVSVQSCSGADGESRVGGEALYAFVHPNLMLNRYGDVLDVNRVLPAGPGACEVIIDWAFAAGASEEAVAACLDQSEQVQQQDVGVCESVQRGLASPAYDRGVYAPRVERAAHAFHRLLASQLRAGLATVSGSTDDDDSSPKEGLTP